MPVGANPVDAPVGPVYLLEFSNHRMPPKESAMGLVFMLFASASFAAMSAMIKGLGTGIPLLELVFLRCVLAIPFFLIFVGLKKRPFMVTAKGVLLLRTLFGMTAMTGYFYALTHMPFAECIFLGRSQPLILALLAPFVLGERASTAAWGAIFSGLAGVALIMRPAMAWPAAAWVAIGAAAASAMAHLLVRRLNATDYPLVIVLNFTILTAFFTSFWVIPNFVAPSLLEWVLIAGVALFASTGQILMTLAYQRDRAPVVASASYASVVISIILGYFIWDEVPHPLAWLGGALIVAGGLILLHTRIHVTEPAAPAAT